MHKERNLHEGHSTVGEWQGTGSVVAGERHGMCESATAGERHAMCESPFNTIGERHGMCESPFNTIWGRHATCESALNGYINPSKT
jgi:hypothetical protein